MKWLLDVDCEGSLFKLKNYESIGLDIYRDYTPQSGDQRHLTKIDKGEYFIQADAQYLPLKNNSMNFVYSSHVIEHVKNPKLMLKEMIRVAKNIVIIRCPHRLGSLQDFPFHIQRLDETFFRKILREKAKIIITRESSIERILAIILYKLKIRRHSNFNPIELFLRKMKILNKIIFLLLKPLHAIGLPREIIVVWEK